MSRALGRSAPIYQDDTQLRSLEKGWTNGAKDVHEKHLFENCKQEMFIIMFVGLSITEQRIPRNRKRKSKTCSDVIEVRFRGPLVLRRDYWRIVSTRTVRVLYE